MKCCHLAGEHKGFGVIYSLPFQCCSSYDFTMKTSYLTRRFWFFKIEILCPFNRLTPNDPYMGRTATHIWVVPQR